METSVLVLYVIALSAQILSNIGVAAGLASAIVSFCSGNIAAGFSSMAWMMASLAVVLFIKKIREVARRG